MLGAKKVTALDLDEVAVQSAKMNIKLNKVHPVVDVFQNNLLEGIQEKADVIVANILAEVIVRFTDAAAQCLKPGGYFITAGIIQQKKDEVKESIESAGFQIEETVQMEDWVSFIAKRK